MTTASALLRFSTQTLQARLTGPDEEVHLERPTLVVNLSGASLVIATGVQTRIPPLSSAVLNRVTLCHRRQLLLFSGWEHVHLPGLGDRAGWLRIGDAPSAAAGAGDGAPFPRDTPLWRSPIEQLGDVALDEEPLPGADVTAGRRALRLTANLWYAPAGTDCHIHRRHDFLEVHTQIAGRGRMQKFHEQDPTTLYQDVPLEPGSTHAPFCATGRDGRWHYPWHRYWADTDCVWLALEYHAIAGASDATSGTSDALAR